MGIKEKRRIVRLLQTDDIDHILTELGRLPGRRVINPLFAGLCNSDELTRWHAVTAMGPIVANIADNDMESARIIMRRLMWSLNDESGGIGWGAPEAMAEIMSCHAGIAKEFSQMIVSYMREDGNFLEHEVLQRGVLWAVCRLAQSQTSSMIKWNAAAYTFPYLNSPDMIGRGLAAWALGLLGEKSAADNIQNLFGNRKTFQFFWDRTLVPTTVGKLAEQAFILLQKDVSP